MQLPMIFSASPGARRSDPLSSHAAADASERSGRAARQRDQVRGLVRRWPGLTSKQLASTDDAAALGLDRYAIARRLPELERARKVSSSRLHEISRELRWFPLADT